MQTEEQTLDEELSAAWQDIQSRGEDDAEADIADAPQAESKPERARDESGKFVKAEDRADDAELARPSADDNARKRAPEAPISGPQESADDDAPPVTPQGRQIDVNRPPSSWRPLAKAEWEKLPETVRAEIHRRESDTHRGLAEIMPDIELGRSIKQVIEPYRMLIEAEGGTPERAVASLLQTAALFRVGTPGQKQAALYQIAQQYGIPMPQGDGQQQQYAAPQTFHDPRVDQLLAQQQREAQLREQREMQQHESIVSTFRNATDQQGQPLRPHFDDVEAEMVALVPAIKAANPGMGAADVLQQAYDRATWAHPEIRQLLQQKQMSELEAKRRAENQRRVTEAKKAASVNTPRRAVVNADGGGDLDEVIRDTARKIGLIN